MTHSQVAAAFGCMHSLWFNSAHGSTHVPTECVRCCCLWTNSVAMMLLPIYLKTFFSGVLSHSVESTFQVVIVHKFLYIAISSESLQVLRSCISHSHSIFLGLPFFLLPAISWPEFSFPTHSSNFLVTYPSCSSQLLLHFLRLRSPLLLAAPLCLFFCNGPFCWFCKSTSASLPSSPSSWTTFVSSQFNTLSQKCQNLPGSPHTGSGF